MDKSTSLILVKYPLISKKASFGISDALSAYITPPKKDNMAVATKSAYQNNLYVLFQLNSPLFNIKYVNFCGSSDKH